MKPAEGKHGIRALLPAAVFLLASVCAYAEENAQANKKVPARPWNALRVMTYNVLKGSPAKKIAADIRRYNPDVALLQEVDSKTKRANGEDQLPLLMKELGLHGFYAPSYKTDGGTTGQAILSRFPLARTELITLKGSRNIGATAVITWRGRSVRLVSTHLTSTYKLDVKHLRESAAMRAKEAARLARMLGALKGDVILGGDLNANPCSEPHRILEKILTRISPAAPTLPSTAPLFQLDHVFATGAFKSARGWAGAPGVSDHLPVIVDVVIKKTTKLPPAGPKGLRMLTWNILYGRNKGDTNNWPKRWRVMKKALARAKPDIFCAQEALPDQITDIAKLLPAHGVVKRSRVDQKLVGEHCAIFYDAKKFELVKSGTFWLSDTPGTASRTWGNKYHRIATWAHLRTKKGGREFRVYNTHFPLKSAPRKKAAALIARVIESEAGAPALLAGDFNEPLGPGVFPNLARAGLADCFGTAQKRAGGATYRVKGIALVRLDWILATPEWKVRTLSTVDHTDDGLHPSDHNGVLAVLDLPGKTKEAAADGGGQ